ncbi:MAG TPA: methyltransferase domain-containing protein [Flavobacteriales bacterium]|nr:methyltransferase domain-containing protein [Flavobacteriales bacterium]
MKVGTDGVLLGSWALISAKAERILDIGTGTGLIALMMAQRSTAEVIDAVELNQAAYQQATENFKASNWSERLSCYHASFQEFSNDMEDNYDLIISNPPFHISTQKTVLEDRGMARHSNHLPFNELLLGVAKLLNKQGSCSFIIPFSEQDNFIVLAEKKDLFPSKITHVKGNNESPIKRSLLQFSFVKNEILKKELVIENSRHIYTKDYKELVKDFYLKM